MADTCTSVLVKMDLRPTSPVKYPEIRTELLALAAEDQKDRLEYFPSTGREFPEGLLKRDKARTKKMLELLEQIKSPSARNIGLDGARATWLLAQHATKPVRQLLLRKMHRLYYKDKSQVFFQGIPYLVDMIMLETSGRQLYGTYSYVGKNGKEQRFPIINPRKLTERRAKFGLCPNGKCQHDN